MCKARVCIDRHLPQNLLRPFRVETDDLRSFAIAPIGKEWINGSTLRVRFMGGTEEQHAAVRRETMWWQLACNLKFAFTNDADAEIRICFNEDDGAWSYVGTDAKFIPFEHPTMNLGWTDGGVIAHEFGHAIGLSHEHQNPAGGIQWNEEAVYRDLSGPPNWWDKETIRHNVLSKYSFDQIRGTAFDRDSIMLYFFPASWTRNGVATKENHVLSPRDIEFVGKVLYPRPTPIDPVQPPIVTPAVSTELDVDSWWRKRADIGKPGEEDLYHFHADRIGRYLINTSGRTDVMMRLYGPDSQSLLIAEDDNNGIGKNAQIQRNLIQGKYWVQIRHADRSSGTGSYTIKARFRG
jgi:hypothetical protein